MPKKGFPRGLGAVVGSAWAAWAIGFPLVVVGLVKGLEFITWLIWAYADLVR